MAAINITQAPLEEAIDKELGILESNKKLTSEDLEKVFEEIAKLQESVAVDGQLLWLEKLNKELKKKAKPKVAIRTAWGVLEKYGYRELKDGWIPPSYIAGHSALKHLLDTHSIKYNTHIIEPYERMSELSDALSRTVKSAREAAVKEFKAEGMSESQAAQEAEKLISFDKIWTEAKNNFKKGIHDGKLTKSEMNFEWDVWISKDGLLMEKQDSKAKILSATSNPHQYLIEIPHITSRYVASRLVNVPVTWTSPGGKEIKGKIVRAHGNNGKFIAHFRKGLPGQAIPSNVQVSIGVANNAAPRLYFTKDTKDLYNTLRRVTNEKDLRLTGASLITLEDTLDTANECGIKHQFDYLGEIPRKFTGAYIVLNSLFKVFYNAEAPKDVLEDLNKDGGITLINKKSKQEVKIPKELAKYWAMFKDGRYEELPDEKEMLARIMFELGAAKQNRISEIHRIAAENWPGKSLEWILENRKSISDAYEMRGDALWTKYNVKSKRKNKQSSWYKVDPSGNVFVEDEKGSPIKADDQDFFEIALSTGGYKVLPKLKAQVRSINKYLIKWDKLSEQYEQAKKEYENNALKKNKRRCNELKKKIKTAWKELESARKELKKNPEWKILKECVTEDLKSNYKETVEVYLDNLNKEDEIDALKRQIELITTAESFASAMYIKNNIPPEKAKDFLDLYDFLRAETLSEANYGQYRKLKTQLENAQDREEYSELKEQFVNFLESNPKYKLIELKNEIKDCEQKLEEVLGDDWETKIQSNFYSSPIQSLIGDHAAAQDKYNNFLAELPHFDALLIKWDPKGIEAKTENGYLTSWHGENYFIEGAMALPGNKMSKVITQELTQEQANVLYALSRYQRGLEDYRPRLGVFPER